MKKFLKIICVLCLSIISCFTFFACEKPQDDKFYEQTNLKFNEFIQNICLNDDYKNGYVYGEQITAILNSINNEEYNDEKLIAYTQLTDTYDKIFASSFYFLSSFEGVFNNIPSEIKNDMKKDYLAFENKLADISKQVEDFKFRVIALDEGIVGTTLQSAISAISLQEVREFKRDYVNLSLNIVDLSKQFLNICEKHIYPKYTSFKQNGEYIELSQTQINNQKTIANLKSAISTLEPAINYLNDFNGDYVKLDTDNMFTTLNNYINLNLQTNTATVQDLEKWRVFYEAYLNELECFNQSLQKIDFANFGKFYNFDIEEFTQENQENYAYVNQIFNFTKNTVKTLYNFNQELCN